MRYLTPRRLSRLVKYVLDKGDIVPTERGLTKELLNFSFAVRTPRDRLATEGWRKMNFPFAVAEWLGMLTGNDDLSLFTNFIKRYTDYSSDGQHVDGAYGARIHQIGDGVEQAIDTLRKNPLSRRVVVPIFSPQDLFGAGKTNTPCTLDLMYVVRDGKLVAITNMRSNDLMFGLTNDLCAFTLMHEYVARQAGLQTGMYIHNAASFHLYQEHWNVLDGWDQNELRWNVLMAPMPRLTHDDVNYTLDAYMHVDNVAVVNSDLEKVNPWMQDLIRAAMVFSYRKDTSTAKVWYDGILDYAIRRVLRPWMTRGE